MSTLNLQVQSVAFADVKLSNNPQIRNWDLNFKLLGATVNNPRSEDFSIAPGSSQMVFSGTRTTLLDGTTAFTVSKPYPALPNTYRFTNTAGTAPAFRTNRLLGVDATSQFIVTVNGPIVTFTSVANNFASYNGLVAGMSSPVVLTANTAGAGGNSIALVGDGTSNINLLISNWNTANPSNQVTLTSGNGLQVPEVQEYADFIGYVTGMTSPVTIKANTIGSIGNSIALAGNGTSNINALITVWNTANPSNQCTLMAGDGTQIPSGGAQAVFSGTLPGINTPVTITAENVGTAGNDICLIGDGVSDLNTLLAVWNLAHPTNSAMISAGDGTQILVNNVPLRLISGQDVAVITLNGGLNTTMALTGGSTDTLMNTTNVQIGDILNVGPGSGFSTANQGQFTILGKTSSTLSVQNLNGVAETVTILDSTQFLGYSNGGGTSNQIQIGDKVIISAGFSPATQGTYDITNITPSYFEIAIAAPNGIPIESNIIPGVAGLVFYSAAKQFVLIAAQQRCSVQVNADTSDNSVIEPVEVDNPEKPALYLKQGTVYSLTIHNLSLQTLNIIVATAE